MKKLFNNIKKRLVLYFTLTATSFIAFLALTIYSFIAFTILVETLLIVNWFFNFEKLDKNINKVFYRYLDKVENVFLPHYDASEIIRYIRICMDNDEYLSTVRYYITKIKITHKSKKKIDIEIWTPVPGMIIVGVHESNDKYIEKFLNDRFTEEINLTVKEDELWIE